MAYLSIIESFHCRIFVLPSYRACALTVQPLSGLAGRRGHLVSAFLGALSNHINGIVHEFAERMPADACHIEPA